MLVDHAPHSGRQEFFERVVFPRFAPGRDVDREARARHQRQPEFDHELHRQFKLLVRDREPGRDLDIAGWGLQNDRGVGQFAFGLNPAAIGLTIGGKHRAVDLRQEADPVQAGGKALPFRTCRGRQMGQAGRLRAWRLWLLPIDGSLARIAADAFQGRRRAFPASHDGRPVAKHGRRVAETTQTRLLPVPDAHSTAHLTAELAAEICPFPSVTLPTKY